MASWIRRSPNDVSTEARSPYQRLTTISGVDHSSCNGNRIIDKMESFANNRRDIRLHLWLGAIACLLALPLLLGEHPGLGQQAIPAAAPVLAPPSGHYAHPIMVSASAAPEGSQLYYTLDGSDPQRAGRVYATPIGLTGPGVTVIRASYHHADGAWSDQATATYIVGLETHLPLLSLIADPADLADPERGLFTHPAGRGFAWERAVELMFFEGSRSDAPHELAFISPAGLRIHGSASRGYPKLSLRLNFRSAYGNPRLNYPLYAGQQDIMLESFDRLVVHSGSQDYATPMPDPRSNWTLLRAPLFYELAAEVGVYTTQSRPTLLFVNGRSYGIYQLRTMPDETFLLDRYGVAARDIFVIDGLSNSAEAWLTAPSARAFEALLVWAETQDVRDPAFYDQVSEKIDMEMFVDYVVLQMYAANTDWLRNNVRMFIHDEKLSWMIWDVDQAFGLAPWGNVETDMLLWLQTTDAPGFERGSLLLRMLLENERFQQHYLRRLDELLDTTLAGPKVARLLAELAAEMRPDIHYETDLWTSPGDWEASVAEMRDFVLRRPDIMREHHAAVFGPFP